MWSQIACGYLLFECLFGRIWFFLLASANNKIECAVALSYIGIYVIVSEAQRTVQHISCDKIPSYSMLELFGHLRLYKSPCAVHFFFLPRSVLFTHHIFSVSKRFLISFYALFSLYFFLFSYCCLWQWVSVFVVFISHSTCGSTVACHRNWKMYLLLLLHALAVASRAFGRKHVLLWIVYLIV